MTIGVFVMTPAFYLPTVIANHTHLAIYTRIVSLHREALVSSDFWPINDSALRRIRSGGVRFLLQTILTIDGVNLTHT